MPNTSSANHEVTLRLEMEPVDTLFFRDARPFEASSRAASGLPMPQTLAGALRTILIEMHGCSLARLGKLVSQGTSFSDALASFSPEIGGIAQVAVSGPWFSRGGAVLFRVPANLMREKGTDRLVRLDPLASPPLGWQPAMKGMLPLWRWGRSPQEAIDGYMTIEGLRQFLEGRTPKDADIVSPSSIFDFDDRTGVGIDEKSNAAGDGRIYGARRLALGHNTTLVAEVRGPANALAPLDSHAKLMRLGGEGGHVRLRCHPERIDWPDIPPSEGTGRLVMMTSPAWFNGWLPPNLHPLAAAVPSPLAVSGWDMARGGPKPNRFMVPAGTVYYLKAGDKMSVDGLVPLDDALVGLGNFVEGNWRHV